MFNNMFDELTSIGNLNGGVWNRFKNYNQMTTDAETCKECVFKTDQEVTDKLIKRKSW
ncbi:MAG: hypothetical protein NPIRA01_05450 [Nitrospirales bacterium]|nr:MAG: hypothetical protein NPIRA01_05450 [Nitrospirales bacterium]